MSLTKNNLLNLLDSIHEPVSKKLKIVDHAFKSSQLLLPHKEAFLLKWIIGYSEKESKETWKILYDWVHSDQFKELNRNDMDNNEISAIIELLKSKIKLMESADIDVIKMVFSSSLILIENGIFQQYFRYNIEVYCQLICCMLDTISCPNYMEEFLKRNLFFKSIVLEEKFHKCFLDLIFPSLVMCLFKFYSNTKLFLEVSKIVQKCLFNKNPKTFSIFLSQFFEDIQIEKQELPIVVLKNLIKIYKEDTENTSMKYRLILHAFCISYESDFDLLYKFFILLVHIIGFKLKEKQILHKTLNLEVLSDELSLKKSQRILLELLDVFSHINNQLDIKVNEESFTEFLRNILKQLLFLKTPSSTSYKIFMKAIIIDPVVIEPMIDSIIRYAMTADNREQKEDYESLIIAVFDVYSKLHRIESLVAKIVSTLSDCFNNKCNVLHEIYEFRGKKDMEVHIMEATDFKTDDIFTKNILGSFSTCVCNLASWQVINVFKTLLYYLNKHLSCINKVENEDFKYFIYMEILSVLIGTLLASIRVAEHTVATNVVEKSVKELEELRNILQNFGVALLNRQHNHILMKSFLNIAYHWGELYTVLAYYSINNEVEIVKSVDNDFTSCNITYLHSYLNVKQWCLISERITNFGELPCKQLLKTLHIQKLKAMFLFEKSINEDIIVNVIKGVTTDVEISCKDIICDKYVVNQLMCKMDFVTILPLAECVINNIDSFEKQLHIHDSSLFITAINYICIVKLNKLMLKHKRKLNDDIFNITHSSKICSTITEDILDEKGHEEILQKVKKIYHTENIISESERKINDKKVCNIFEKLKRFPIIYGNDVVQKIFFLYFCSVHRDLLFEFKRGNYGKLQIYCEDMIIGLLQHNKIKLLDAFDLVPFCKEGVESYKEWDIIFTLITENAFKYENYIKSYEPLIMEFTEDLSNSTYMQCCLILLNTINKMKKMKLSKDIKVEMEKYKTIICDKILKVVSENDPKVSLVKGYIYALRTFLPQNVETSELLKHLDIYIDFALNDTQNCEEYLGLFITILQNRSKVKCVHDDISFKIWNIYKENEHITCQFEEYAQLISLICGHIPNEEFEKVTQDLLNITDNLVRKDVTRFGKNLKTWESIVCCNLNPIKTKTLSNAIEGLLPKLMVFLQESIYDENLFNTIYEFERIMIQTNHVHLSPYMIDILILNSTLFMQKENKNFKKTFILSISLLDCLLRHRKPMIMDRLPPFLQQFRVILKSLCQKSNSDLSLEDVFVREISDCAHELEKFTRNLVYCQKDMGRIAMYLIADILEQYEKTTLYPGVKIHLNNCVYSLISVCDQHAVTYLMRVLSSASTEIFKVMYENYKKYYRFTGKI